MDQQKLLWDETYAVIGAAMEVHTVLRSGFLESVYQEAMSIELHNRGIPFVAQSPLRLNYKGRVLQKTFIADFICYQAIIAEIKSTPDITSTDESQILNYLHATGVRVGVLICFGDPGRLAWQRYIV